MSDPLLSSLQIGSLTLKNRIVSTCHAPAIAEDGMPKERYQRYHLEKAKGGIAMTMIGGSSCVSPDSPSVFGQLDVSSDRMIPYFTEFADRIHKEDCRIVCQISHLGRRTTWNDGDWLPVIAPSRVREPAHRGFPKEMDHADIKRVIGDYIAAARRLRDSGFDGVEILQNGHLPGQFLSPDTNLRDDIYGGSFDNRLRFIRELYDAVKDAIGDDIVIGARVEMDSKLAEGLQQDEALKALQIIEHDGTIDYFNLNVGRSDTDYMLANHPVPAMFKELAPFVQLAGLFKQNLKTPTIHAARISDLATARYAIKEGMMDLVGMTRAHIADPHLVHKLQSGREEEIRPCVGAGYCIDRIYNEGEMLCIHNVATTREQHIPHITLPATGDPKTVVVIGGGPAGMEAARVSALRGHNVTLIEAASELGGQVRLAAQSQVRKDLIGIVNWLEQEIKRLNVEIVWQIFADDKLIADLAPDIVVVATGGIPDHDHVSGGELARSTWDVLAGEALVQPAGSETVMVYDDHGQHQAASTVVELCKRGFKVHLVTPDRHAVHEMGSSNYPMYIKAFHDYGVDVTPNFRLKSLIRDGNGIKAELTSDFGDHPHSIAADHVVVEHGTLPNDEVYHDLIPHANNGGITDIPSLIAGEPQPTLNKADGFSLFRVGDAVASRNIHAAILDSRRLCQTF